MTSRQQEFTGARLENKQQTKPQGTTTPKPGPRPGNKQRHTNKAGTNQAGTKQSGAKQVGSKIQETAKEQAITPANLAQRGTSTQSQQNPRPAKHVTPKPTRPTQAVQAAQPTKGGKKATSSKRATKREPQKTAATQRPRRTPPARKTRLNTQDELSAGGLVFSGLAEAVDRNNKVDLSKIYVALIGRLDRRGRILWSIPKGHVEGGEDIIKTAEREVWEETGVYGEVFDKLGIIDYWFISDGVQIHKTVHHHLLRYVDGELNDEDPEVTEVAWIPANELTEHFAYADERKLARKIYRILPNIARAEKEAGRRTPRP